MIFALLLILSNSAFAQTKTEAQIRYEKALTHANQLNGNSTISELVAASNELAFAYQDLKRSKKDPARIDPFKGTPNEPFVSYEKFILFVHPEKLKVCENIPRAVYGQGLIDEETGDRLVIESLGEFARALWITLSGTCYYLTTVLSTGTPAPDAQEWFERFGTALYNAEQIKKSHQLLTGKLLPLSTVELFKQIEPLFHIGGGWNWSLEASKKMSHFQFQNLLQALNVYFTYENLGWTQLDRHSFKQPLITRPSGAQWIRSHVTDARHYDFALNP